MIKIVHNIEFDLAVFRGPRTVEINITANSRVICAVN